MFASTTGPPCVGLVADISPLPRGELDVGDPNLGHGIKQEVWTAWHVRTSCLMPAALSQHHETRTRTRLFLIQLK